MALEPEYMQVNKISCNILLFLLSLFFSHPFQIWHTHTNSLPGDSPSFGYITELFDISMVSAVRKGTDAMSQIIGKNGIGGLKNLNSRR
jgi:hypothetical protein